MAPIFCLTTMKSRNQNQIAEHGKHSSRGTSEVGPSPGVWPTFLSSSFLLFSVVHQIWIPPTIKDSLRFNGTSTRSELSEPYFEWLFIYPYIHLSQIRGSFTFAFSPNFTALCFKSVAALINRIGLCRIFLGNYLKHLYCKSIDWSFVNKTISIFCLFLVLFTWLASFEIKYEDMKIKITKLNRSCFEIKHEGMNIKIRKHNRSFKNW